MKFTDNVTLATQPISQQLMTAQLGIYRAEWDLEADMHADKQAAVRNMVKHQMTFHHLCGQPELAHAVTDDARGRELRRLHAHARNIPMGWIEETASAALRGLQAWHAARVHNDFKVLLEPFRNLITLQKKIGRQRADNLMRAYGWQITPYEALIDAYDPGRRLAFIHESFGKVAGVCREILDRKATEPGAGLAYPVDQQAAICRSVITRMGYDADAPRGDLSLSAHPFCRRVGRREVWLTNRYDEKDFLPALLTIVHEGGHGRYYQGLPVGLADDWMGGVCGETINEGMALFAEQVVGRSRAFCDWVAPRIGFATGTKLDSAHLHQLVTRVQRDRLRTDAGEVIYPLHLLLRLAVEEALINDDMDVEELPHFWREKSRELMGFEPKDDNEGCLQDIQLYVGYIGYFPCYLLGFMVAAQMGAAITRQHPTIAEDWAKGDFDRLNQWLSQNVYHYGRTVSPDTLVMQATGSPLGPDALIAHLQSRYS